MKLLRSLSVFAVGVSLLVIPAWGTHAKSHTSSHPTSHSLRSSNARPYYGGGRHTSSHGGSYGVTGSTHRSGHYTSTTGSHHYGRHK
jgi:hypothetical protein